MPLPTPSTQFPDDNLTESGSCWWR